MEAQAQQFGLASRQPEEPEDRSHTVIEKIVLAAKHSRPAMLHQECDVFFVVASLAGLAVAWPCAAIEAELTIGISFLRATCFLSPKAKKKADVGEHFEMFSHVGLLSNELPGRSGPSFT